MTVSTLARESLRHRRKTLGPRPVRGTWAIPVPVPRPSSTHVSAYFPELRWGGPLVARQARLGESVMDDAGQFPSHLHPRRQGFSIKLTSKSV